MEEGEGGGGTTMAAPSPAPAPVLLSDDEDAENECRVCRVGEEADRPLFHPCACSGSIRYIHQDCLEQWLKVANRAQRSCELCGVAFRFTPIYKEGAPLRLTAWQFATGVLSRVSRVLPFALRAFLALLLWGGVLPLCTFTVSRVFFCHSIAEALSAVRGVLKNPYALPGDLVLGIGLCVIIVAAWAVLLTLYREVYRWSKEQIGRMRPQGARQDENNHGEHDHNHNVGEAALQQGAVPEPPLPPVIHAIDMDEVDAGAGVNNDDFEAADLGFLLGIQGPIGLPFQAVAQTLCFYTAFLGVFQLIPFQIGSAATHWWMTGQLGRGDATAAASEAEVGRGFSKLLIEAALSGGWGVVDEEGLHVAATQAERDLAGLLKLSSDLRAMGVGYAVIVGLCMFPIVALLIYGLVTRTPTDAGGPSVHQLVKQQARAATFTLLQYGKVGLLLAGELVALPLWVGCLMDLFTLRVLGSSVEERMKLLSQAPALSIFVHWFVGFAYAVGVSSTLLELRRVLRAELLVDHLPQPDQLNPERILRQLVERPLAVQLQKLVFLFLQYVPCLVITLYLPVRAGTLLFGLASPLQLRFEEPFVELQLPMELLLFHVVLPMAIEKCNARQAVYVGLCWWMCHVCHFLSIDDVLVDPEVLREWRSAPPQEQLQPRPPPPPPQERPPVEDHNGVPPTPPAVAALADNAIGLASEEEKEEEEEREQETSELLGPPRLAELSRASLRWRVTALVSLSCLALWIISVLVIHIPLYAGRAALYFMSVPVENDCYSLFIGLLLVWATVSTSKFLVQHLLTQLQREAFMRAIQTWIVISLKWAVLGFLWLGVAPVLIGTLFETLIIIPVLVPVGETPRFALIQNWALGLVALKVWVQGVLMGAVALGGGAGQEQWSARLERVYANGVRNVDFLWTLREVCLRLLNTVGEYYFVPYFFTKAIAPLVIQDPLLINFLNRYSVCLYLLMKAALHVVKQCIAYVRELHDHIKDERYLVGMRLHNIPASGSQEGEGAPDLAVLAAALAS
jgi:E3 ubiquitin-protein ligase MARCH6